MSETFYFGTNFKMHQTHAESARFVDELMAATKPDEHVQLFLIPPFTSLAGLAQKVTGQQLWIGAQNMHFAEAGEYTGEISAPMLAALGVNLVMLGHAERRKHFGETDEAINQKIHTALAHGLRVLLCVGETALHRQYGIAREIVAQQLKIALYGVDVSMVPHLMLAYEPIWAIGAGSEPATPAQVEPIVAQMRHTLDELYGDEAPHIPILYGGSINAENCRDFARMSILDGLFVGRAVRYIAGFVSILNDSTQAWKSSL